MSSDGISKATDTHTALSMAGERILSRKAGAAGAFVRLVARMNLCMSLQVVLANEAFAASVALKLTVSKMCLDVGSNVFSSAENLTTVKIKTSPFTSNRILFTDISLDFFRGNTSVLEACVNIEIVEHW